MLTLGSSRCNEAHQNDKACTVLQPAGAGPGWCDECINSGAGQIISRGDTEPELPTSPIDKSANSDSADSNLDNIEEMDEDELLFDADLLDDDDVKSLDTIPPISSEAPNTGSDDSEFIMVDKPVAQTLGASEDGWETINLSDCNDADAEKSAPGPAAAAWLAKFGARMTSSVKRASVPTRQSRYAPMKLNIAAGRALYNLPSNAAAPSRAQSWLDSFTRSRNDGSSQRWVRNANAAD